jgi:transposase
MARPLIDDALWEKVQPLLPPPKPRRSRYPGRKPIDDRRALTGILFVLKMGIPWEALPQEMGCGSGMTCWRRLQHWQRAGAWSKIEGLISSELREADRINWSRAARDRSAEELVFAGEGSTEMARQSSGPVQQPDERNGAAHSPQEGHPLDREEVAEVGQTEESGAADEAMLSEPHLGAASSLCKNVRNDVPQLELPRSTL